MSLILLFVMPLLFSVLFFALAPLTRQNLRPLALVLSLLPLFLLIIKGSSWIGMSVHYPWLPTLSIEFYLEIDALSLIFLYLTAIVIPISLMVLKSESYGLVFLLEALLIGFFTARDLVFFTLFWEAMLIPLYLIIAFWGAEKRGSASLKFLIYMIAGSTLMIAAVLGLYEAQGTFNLSLLKETAAHVPYALPIFFIFMLAFAVKTPLFPFHAWLPDAYCQAPTGGSILLAALLSKAGIYGIFRIGLGLFPLYLAEWSSLFFGCALAGVLYAGLAAWRQQDFKRLIAYSSLSHVNFILAGLFVMSATAHTGALLQAFNHGITITALFLVAGWLEGRLGGTQMDLGGGLAKWLPRLCWLTLFFALSSVALPGTNNFIGELLILFGTWGTSPWLALLLGLTVILSVMYMLRFIQKIYFGPPKEQDRGMIDISWQQWIILVPLIVIILWIGIYPGPILKVMEGI